MGYTAGCQRAYTHPGAAAACLQKGTLCELRVHKLKTAPYRPVLSVLAQLTVFTVQVLPMLLGMVQLIPVFELEPAPLSLHRELHRVGSKTICLPMCCNCWS